MSYYCARRCEHGSLCGLPRGHQGKHATGYCEFTDAEALSDERGDAVFNAKNPEAAIFTILSPSSEEGE